MWPICFAKVVKYKNELLEYFTITFPMIKSTKEVKRLRTLPLEVIKTRNNVNPECMKAIYFIRQPSRRIDHVI